MDRFMIRYICFCLFVYIAKDEMFVFVLHTYKREALARKLRRLMLLWMCSGRIFYRRECWWEWMKEKRGWRRREDERKSCWKIPYAVGIYSLRSTDPLADPHLSSSSLPATPSIHVVRSENVKRRGEERRREVNVRREEAGRTRMRWRKGSNLVMLKTSIHVSNAVDPFVCCISHLSIEVGEVRWDEVRLRWGLDDGANIEVGRGERASSNNQRWE